MSNDYLTKADFYRYMDGFKDNLNERLGEMRGDITRLQANSPPTQVSAARVATLRKDEPHKNGNAVKVLAEVIRLLVVALLAAFGVRFIG